MYCILFRNTMVICIMIFSCMSILYAIDHLCTGAGFRDESAIELNAAEDGSKASYEHIASNDFSLKHRSGKDERLQHSLVTSIRSEKLIRECLFDREKIVILTQTLIWFTHSTYRFTLPPLWHPSIIIAHRRIII